MHSNTKQDFTKTQQEQNRQNSQGPKHNRWIQTSDEPMTGWEKETGPKQTWMYGPCYHGNHNTTDTLIPAPPNTVSVSVLCWERSSIQVISTHWWSYECSCVFMNMVHSSEVSFANELALRVSTFSWKLRECCCFFIFCRCGQLGYSIYQDKWKWIFLMKHNHSRENNINVGMLTLFVVLCWFCTYLKRLFKMQCRVMVC